jgi:hypothetical protein
MQDVHYIRVVSKKETHMEQSPPQVARETPPPFDFFKAAYLKEATTLTASSLPQLLTGVTLAPALSIFYHLHHHYFVHPEVLPAYPNEFAQWVGEVLGNGVVAEQLANLNLFRATTLQDVRREIAVLLAQYLTQHEESHRAPIGREFIFCRPWFVMLPSGRRAATPREFLTVLHALEYASVAYHLFAPKVAPQGARNDFAKWFAAWGYTSLATELDSFDPYLNSLQDNRSYLVELITTALSAGEEGTANYA